MHSTREVLRLLRSVNPGKEVTEDRIRRALRRGDIPPPDEFAGRLAWSSDDLLLLADALELTRPDLDEAGEAEVAS